MRVSRLLGNALRAATSRHLAPTVARWEHHCPASQIGSVDPLLQSVLGPLASRFAVNRSICVRSSAILCWSLRRCSRCLGSSPSCSGSASCSRWSCSVCCFSASCSALSSSSVISDDSISTRSAPVQLRSVVIGVW